MLITMMTITGDDDVDDDDDDDDEDDDDDDDEDNNGDNDDEQNLQVSSPVYVNNFLQTSTSFSAICIQALTILRTIFIFLVHNFLNY